MKVFNCLNCDTENKWSHRTTNKYCNHKCQQEYRFKTDTLVRFKKGLIEERSTLRKCLTETIGYNCKECGLSDWNGKPITLQVDHINGDPSNHKPKNLQLLCPNCHSQTPHFGGKNKGNGRKSKGMKLR